MSRASVVRGTLSFIFILLMMPLGHAFVVLMSHYLSGWALTSSAVALGVLGVVGAVVADKMTNRDIATAIGAFGGVLVWGGWVEFIYMTYARGLGVPPLVEGGEVVTKPEYLIMPTALPFAIIAFIMMVFGGHTSWGVVRWLRCRLRITVVDSGRSSGLWTLIELVLLIWYAYLVLLIMYDKDILGDRHPVTIGFAFICLAVAIELFVRQLRLATWSSALRASVVTVCVLWTFIEVMIRLGLFTEIWVHPADYLTEMILIAVAFVAVTLFLVRKKD